MTDTPTPEPAPSPFLYVTTLGHRSGRPHEIEIWYIAHEGRYYIVAEHRERAHWVQNIRRQPQVTFRVAGVVWSGSARVVDAAAEPALALAVSALMDAKYQWSDGLIVELTPSERIGG